MVGFAGLRSVTERRVTCGGEKLELFALRVFRGEEAREFQGLGEQAAADEASARAALVAAEAGSRPSEAQEERPSGGRNGGGQNARREQFRQRRDRGNKIMTDTLAEGDDRIEIDSRLTETGMRTRVRLEEGFVKIFGRLLAAQFASSPEPVDVEASKSDE